MKAEPSLLRGGMVLILLGFFAGAAIPAFLNPRMGLSAHQVGVQAGVLLVVMSLVWFHLDLSGRLSPFVRRLLLYAGYSIWFSSLLGGIWGTSKATPIAGAGYTGDKWQEAVVALGLASGSIAALAGVGAIVFVLMRSREES